MGKEAVGTYLRTLREARGWPRVHIVRLVPLDDRQLGRIEAGEIDTRGSLLLALTDVLEGNLDDVKRLLLDKSATAEDGRKLAEAWLNGGKQASTPLPSELEDLVRELAGDPLRLRQWIGYGERLLDERQAVGQL